MNPLPWAGTLVLAALLFLVPTARAGDKKPVSLQVASNGITGALLQRQVGGAWRATADKEPFAPGTELIALPDSILHSVNGAVEVRLKADIGQRGPFPVLETSIIVNAPGAFDVDVTLQCGILVLVNTKKEGEAKARVRFANQAWDLTLHDPGTKVGLELYARHSPEVGRTLDGKAEPTINVLLLVTKGEALLETGGKGFGLKAPPGTAVVLWDNHIGTPRPQRLEKLPDFASPLSDKEKQVIADIDTCIKCLTKEPMAKVVDRLLSADKKLDRGVGVTLLGAIDDVPRLVEVLASHKHADARQQAILVLRHWLGQGQDHCQQMRQVLIREQKYTRIQALSLVQMLLGFTDEELGEPATYQVLITFLEHKHLPFRELAHWHLVRLVPDGHEISYDAAASPEIRQRAVQMFRDRVPDGKLPQRPTKKK